MYGINLLINYLYTGSSDEQGDPTKYSDKFKVIDALVIITYKSCGPLFICYVLKYIIFLIHVLPVHEGQRLVYA